MNFMKIICLVVLIILSLACFVENRSYNNGLIFYNSENQQIYLPPTISVSRGRSLAKFKYSPRGSIWSTFGKPCDCTGPLCGCCVGMRVKQYKFDQKICANVSYAPIRDEIQLEVFLNETSTAKYGIAARNPSPLCIPIMMGIPMSMCVQMSNVGLMGDNLNMCMDFMVRLASSDLFEMHFQCMKLGLQGASWVGSDGQPVIPANEGKIKDKSTAESEEYYDESQAAVSAENEIDSVEKEDLGPNESVTHKEYKEEEDLNKSQEEIDYNDITERVVENTKEQGPVNEISEEPVMSEQLLQTENTKKEKEDFHEKFNTEENKTNENDEQLFSEEIKENEIIKISPNATEDVENELVLINSTEQEKTTEDIEQPLKTETQNLSQEHLTSQSEIESEEITEASIYEINLNTSTQTPEVVQLQMVTNSLEPSKIANMLVSDKEIMPMTTEHNYDEETSQTVEKFEILITDGAKETTEMNKTSQYSTNSLEILKQPVETSTKHFMPNDMKSTLVTSAVIMTETTSETGIDNIDNALTTASITATTTTTMKMPILLTEENLAVPASPSENNQHNSNGANKNGEGNDGNENSHETDSDYDDEESEELEDETTEKAIEETDDATTITNIIMPIATNDLNNEKIIVSTAATNENENNQANDSNSNESISNNEDDDNDEDEDESKDVQTESEEYDEEDDEDYDTTIATTNNTPTPSLLKETHTKNESTNKVQMTEKDLLVMMPFDKNINSLATTEDGKIVNMPQVSAVTTATTTKTIDSSHTYTSTTTVKPLPLARKIFALHHQNQQRQLENQQKYRHRSRLQNSYHV